VNINKKKNLHDKKIVEQIIESFLYKTFLKQEEEFNYEKIQIIYKLAAINAASTEITRGGGYYGYLAIVLDNKIYNALTGLTFMLLTNLGLVPIIASNARLV